MAKNEAVLHKAEAWQRRWEVCQMALEDLQAANARATMRRHELVSSYWPVMERLDQAEEAVAALSKQVSETAEVVWSSRCYSALSSLMSAWFEYRRKTQRYLSHWQLAAREVATCSIYGVHQLIACHAQVMGMSHYVFACLLAGLQPGL